MVSSPDSSGGLPLHWATCSYLFHKETCLSVKERTQSIVRVIELLLDIDSSAINKQDSQGNTPLHYATRNPARQHKPYTAIFRFLCSRGADAGVRNNKGETPLHTLVSDCRRSRAINADTEAIAILLANGASVADLDYAGNTPLHRAALNVNRCNVISFLLEQGADADSKNLEQSSPLHIAASGKFYPSSREEREKLQQEIMAILSNASEGGMNIPNAEGKTPQRIFHEQRHKWRDEEIRRRAFESGRGRGMGRGRGQ
jgi:ankyrin repeat protein